MADPKSTTRFVSTDSKFDFYANVISHAELYANNISANSFNVGSQTLEEYIQSVGGGGGSGDVTNNYVTATFVSNNYLEDIKSTFGTGDVTNNYVTATFSSNNYVQDILDTKATNTYVNSTFTSNNYVDGRFTSNSFVKDVFTSNSYVGTQLGTKLDSSSYTASDVLAKIKTVDGSGSGLDADLLDGIEASQFLRSDVADTKTSGDLNFSDNIKAVFGTGSDLQIFHDGTHSLIKNVTVGDIFIENLSNDRDISIRTDDGTGGITNYIVADGSTGAVKLAHYGSEKLATTSTGVNVTGELLVNSKRAIVEDDLIQAFNPFGHSGEIPLKLFASHLTDRFGGRASELYVTKDGVEISDTNKNRIFDGSFDTSWTAASAGDADFVLNVNTVTNGLTNSNGFTYANGTLKLAFYPGRGPDATPTARWKDRNNVYRTLTVTEDYRYSSDYIGYEISGLSGNWFTDIEITISPKSDIECRVAALEYHGDRMGLKEGPLLTTLGGTFHNVINAKFEGSETIKLTPSDGSVSFASSAFNVTGSGDVGIGTANPATELDVTGNITVSGTVDGRDIASDGSTLDNISGSYTSNNYLVATFAANSYLVSHFTSNNYIQTYVSSEIASLVDSAPTTLDTLNELAAALGDDPNFATTVTNQIGIRATNTYVNSTFTSNNYLQGLGFTTNVGDVTNNYLTATFTSNNYLQGLGYTTNTGDVSNNYLQGLGFTTNVGDVSNNYLVATFTSNNYVQTQLGLKLNSSSYTAADVLTKIKTVDGAGSGLDADLLDGQHASAFQTVTAPNSPSITSTAVVNETIELVFGQSSTSGVTRYEVWSDGATGSDYSLIAIIPSQDAAASMSVIDSSFDTDGTVAYRVYAVKNGVYSTAATTTKSFTIPSLDVSNMSVVADITAFHVQYDLPDTRFMDHIEIYKDAETTLSALSRTGAALVYSGSSDNFTYTIPTADLDKFHQFWVEVVSV